VLKKLWPVIVWALIILALTGFPGSYFPKVVSFFDWVSPDKIVHFILFGGQSFLILYVFRQQYFIGNHRLLIALSAIGFSTFYGLLTEVLQNYVFIGRNGNVYDFIADALGALLGFLAFYLLYRKKMITAKADRN